MKKNVDINLLCEILSSEKITQEQFGKNLGYSKQYIWSLLNGKRPISTDVAVKIENKYPQYVDCSMDRKVNAVDIAYCPDIVLPYIIKQNSFSVPRVFFDKRLFPQHPRINPLNSKIVTMGVNSLSPYFKNTDKVIIDESYHRFINDEIFVFEYLETSYVRKIIILPDKIKCISFDENEDTFYIPENEKEKVKVSGLIVPNIRL